MHTSFFFFFLIQVYFSTPKPVYCRWSETQTCSVLNSSQWACEQMRKMKLTFLFHYGRILICMFGCWRMPMDTGGQHHLIKCAGAVPCRHELTVYKHRTRIIVDRYRFLLLQFIAQCRTGYSHGSEKVSFYLISPILLCNGQLKLARLWWK